MRLRTPLPGTPRTNHAKRSRSGCWRQQGTTLVVRSHRQQEAHLQQAGQWKFSRLRRRKFGLDLRPQLKPGSLSLFYFLADCWGGCQGVKGRWDKWGHQSARIVMHHLVNQPRSNFGLIRPTNPQLNNCFYQEKSTSKLQNNSIRSVRWVCQFKPYDYWSEKWHPPFRPIRWINLLNLWSSQRSPISVYCQIFRNFSVFFFSRFWYMQDKGKPYQ